LPEQVDSAIDIAPSTGSFPDNYDYILDGSNWLNDAMPGSFMDFSGVPDFDSIIQQYLDPNAVMWN
jgi:hypothetical protein